MNRINTAYVVHSLHSGGIERCVVNLANYLPRDQFTTSIISLTNAGEIKESVAKHVNVIQLHKKAGKDYQIVNRLSDVLAKYSVDVVHSHNWGTLIETGKARLKANVPVHIHTEHGQGLHTTISFAKKVLRGLACRWAAKHISELCVCAECVKPLVSSRFGVSESRIKLLSNGVPEVRLGETTIKENRVVICKKLAIPTDAKIIGSVGRLVEVKGFELAIEGLRFLSNQKNVYLILVGDGPHRKSLERFAIDMGVEDRVKFVGNQTDVSNWLYSFDVFINTSHSEAMSLSILEAMSCGLPVVASAVGDSPSLIELPKPCGLIVRGRDPAIFAEHCLELLNNDELRQGFSDNARSKYRNLYSVDAMTDQHAHLYQLYLSR